MNIEATRTYYENMLLTDLCDCNYCQNYIKEIKKTYPLVANYLEAIGVNIEKPFETMPLEPDNNKIEYIAAQYIVFGDFENFKETTISNVSIQIANSYPNTNINEKHFVIEISPIILNWVYN